QLSRLLARLGQELYDLLHAEPVERVAIDRHDLVPWRNAGLRGWRPRQRLQHDHAPGQYRDHAAEPLLRGSLHLLELLELAGIEEHRMRIEAPQHARNDALKKRLLRGDRIGGVIFGN